MTKGPKSCSKHELLVESCQGRHLNHRLELQHPLQAQLLESLQVVLLYLLLEAHVVVQVVLEDMAIQVVETVHGL